MRELNQSEKIRVSGASIERSELLSMYNSGMSTYVMSNIVLNSADQEKSIDWGNRNTVAGESGYYYNTNDYGITYKVTWADLGDFYVFDAVAV
ncbi:hypothetical protein [Erwinia mallotivora]|uniref:hypothetical protein n=1 Tax=Erwinia mallotivora TaxID=69222 RepID=UPI0021C0F4F4|nr:hypothetical protein [Erwinia mallotivora]